MDRFISDEMLTELRKNIANVLSERRYRHTVEVEKMAVRLGEIYCFEDMPKLRAAALLHDITKEYTDKVHISVLSKPGIDFDKEDRIAPKTFHARTAALLIPELYPEYADSDLVTAVRWHTTGRANMSLIEKLLYLADYIDMSRTFSDCVALRDYFFSACFDEMDENERMAHLNRTLLKSFDMTINALVDEGRIISKDTINARNHIICELG